jgi:peptide chain release factor
MARKLDDLQNGELSRSAIVAEVTRRRKASAEKKSRRKYRALAEEKVTLSDRSHIAKDGIEAPSLEDKGESQNSP